MRATRKQTHAAQQILEVPSPQHQITCSAADVQQTLFQFLTISLPRAAKPL